MRELMCDHFIKNLLTVLALSCTQMELERIRIL